MLFSHAFEFFFTPSHKRSKIAFVRLLMMIKQTNVWCNILKGNWPDMFTSASSLWKIYFTILRMYLHAYWKKPKQTAHMVEAGMVDWLSFQIDLPHIWPSAAFGMCVRLSAYLSVWLFASLSVCLSGLLHPDRLGTQPALCHMISLEAAGVKLIWSGLKAYQRLMLHINCSHLNSPFPPPKCPSCPCTAPKLTIKIMITYIYTDIYLNLNYKQW